MDAQSTKHDDVTSVASVWQSIKTCLELRRSQVYQELRNYPPPITACDQQFNYLLEKQAAILRELARLHHDLAESQSRDDSLGSIHEFIRSSSGLDDQTKRRILLELNDTLSKLNVK